MTSGPYFSAATEPDPSLTLWPLFPEDCPLLAAAIVAMEPWSVMDYPADRLSEYLAEPEGGVTRCLIEVDGEKAGVISVRYPWLKGPYLELLALHRSKTKASGGRCLRGSSTRRFRARRGIFLSALRRSTRTRFASITGMSFATWR